MATLMHSSGEAAAVDADARAQTPTARQRTPVEVTATILGGRHAAPILWSLFWGGRGFYQIFRELDGISRRALALELEDLERVGLIQITRRSRPTRAEYSLTLPGQGLKLVLGAMYEWGLHAQRLGLAEALEDKRPSGSQVEHSRAVRKASDAGEVVAAVRIVPRPAGDGPATHITLEEKCS